MIGNHVRNAGRSALDFLFPPTCAACHRPPHDPLNDSPSLCSDCRAGIAPSLPHRCLRCSAPVGPHLDTARGCVHCAADRFAFENVLSLGVYDGPLRSAVLTAKQPHGDRLTAALAELLALNHAEAFSRQPIELIVPVPHHWTERLLRRHLPPVTLAARLARVLNAPCSPHILAKVRRTRPQAQLEPTDRRNNLRDAFRLIGRPQLQGTRILLVDDVLTTGTTAHRAAALLKSAGATVHVAVIARGLGARPRLAE